MKSILTFVLSLALFLVSLSSCVCEHCKNCGRPLEYGEYLYCRYCYYNYCHHTPTTTPSTTSSDRFTADVLIGTWQMNYDKGYFNGMGIVPKEIEFFDGHTCDITYCKSDYMYDPDWFTDTYTYTYTSGYIKFNKGRITYMFKFRNFLFPTLTVQDSFGTYEWYKRK